MSDACYMMKPLIHPYTMSLRITLEHCELTLYPWNLSGVGRGRYGHVWWDLHVTIGFWGIICCQWLPKNGGILHNVSWSRITVLSDTTETYRNCVPQMDANCAMKSKQHGINNISFLIHISDILILTPIIYKPKSTYWTCVFCKLNKQTTSSYFSLPFSWLSSFLSSFPSWRPALQVSPVAFFVPELITVCCWRVSQDRRKIYLPYYHWNWRNPSYIFTTTLFCVAGIFQAIQSWEYCWRNLASRGMLETLLFIRLTVSSGAGFSSIESMINQTSSHLLYLRILWTDFEHWAMWMSVSNYAMIYTFYVDSINTVGLEQPIGIYLIWHLMTYVGCSQQIPAPW